MSLSLAERRSNLSIFELNFTMAIAALMQSAIYDWEASGETIWFSDLAEFDSSVRKLKADTFYADFLINVTSRLEEISNAPEHLLAYQCLLDSIECPSAVTIQFLIAVGENMVTAVKDMYEQPDKAARIFEDFPTVTARAQFAMAEVGVLHEDEIARNMTVALNSLIINIASIHQEVDQAELDEG